MGGVQSGTHNLGDALWMHERQRQKGQREVSRYESQSAHNTQDRRKLLKRTRSLAVVSEDSKYDGNFSLGEPTLDLRRRPQLIPRAKLIDRNSLKDRLSKSQQHLSQTYDSYITIEPRTHHSTCDLHTSTLPHLQEQSRNRITASRENPDRLNILNWPKTPRRYRSHQDLDTVSGLVDIVEANWPPNEGQRDIYTQVKRKRKEHRSLDSILFEDEDELEYFDVLNLLPLSKVRLEFDEADVGNCNFTPPSARIKQIDFLNVNETSSIDGNSMLDLERRQTPRILQVSEFSDDNQDSLLLSVDKVTNEEKCQSNELTISPPKTPTDQESWKSFISNSSGGQVERTAWETDSHRESFDITKDEVERQEFEITENKKNTEDNGNLFEELVEKASRSSTLTIDDCSPSKGDNVEKVQVVEDTKSIWISDSSEEIDDMSRRPQVLKIIDNDITKRRSWAPNVIDIDIVARQESNMKSPHIHMENEDNLEKENVQKPVEIKKAQASVELARNFFDGKAKTEKMPKSEKIVNEMSTIIGKVCNAVKENLGFEARSESSDLGLGSDCGSDTRRRSIDDGIDDDISASPTNCEKLKKIPSKSHTSSNTNSLTRSQSCLNSLKCQDADGPEFDHVRYKIVKSRLFGKNIYGNIPNKGDVGYDGLMQYLREYSFQELLLDNNVVIIEPVRRAQPVEIKTSFNTIHGKSSIGCKVASVVPKKGDNYMNNDSLETSDNENSKNISKQSSLRKHFFYHPIRVNRELIDEELPDPDTVKNVRMMFEATLRPKSNITHGMTDEGVTCKGNRKSISMKDLSNIEERRYEDVSPRNNLQTSRCRSSSRAKDLTRLFERLDKGASAKTMQTAKEEQQQHANDRNESKTRILAQTFEGRSGDSSPTYSGCARRSKVKRHYRQHQLNNWDTGSVSSGVSSDYPDTDPGSGEAQCSSSDDEDIIDCRGDDEADREDGHYVSPDVLKKIRECGTSVTYYGGKVVNTCNGPLISPTSCKIVKRNQPSLRLDDYVKFRLVKSNSCDSRLELTGRVVERRSRLEAKQRENNNNNASSKSMGSSDLRTCTIAESPSIEITTGPDNLRFEDDRVEIVSESVIKREPPIVIGLEPKKDDSGSFLKAHFKLGKIHHDKANIINKFGSALTKWQINDCDWKKNQADFGKMEFEEFEVLEDSLNGTDDN